MKAGAMENGVDGIEDWRRLKSQRRGVGGAFMRGETIQDAASFEWSVFVGGGSALKGGRAACWYL